MQLGRKLSTLTTLGVLVASTALLPVGPSWADPSIDDVQTRVDRLYHQAEQAQERLHDIRLDLTDLRRDLRALEADQRRQDRRLALVQGQVEDAVVQQYEGQGISTVGQVVVSEDPAAFLSQISTLAAYNDLQAGLFEDYNTELKALGIRSDATTSRAQQIAQAERQAATESAAIDKKLAEAKSLLADLKEKEREEILSRGGTTRLPSSVPASGRAAVAVKFALAQVGKAYVYGAAGPSAYDCSGLTMRAWGAAGVGLPHSSSAQMGSGPRVASSALRPGDLVFYYSPVSHVAIYIGNGLIVHAAHPGAGVRVAGVFSMPYSGAVRPG
ncbi:MAG: NlpC/P60 family protein [Nocardioides sp.]